jgi:hypothetical protein
MGEKGLRIPMLEHSERGMTRGEKDTWPAHLSSTDPLSNFHAFRGPIIIPESLHPQLLSYTNNCSDLPLKTASGRVTSSFPMCSRRRQQ